MTRPRTAAQEWARRCAADALPRLDWAGAALDERERAFTIATDADGQSRFYHVDLASWLPPAMAEEARGAQARGEPTLLEAMQLLLARPQWLVRTRHTWWSPTTPMPELLRPLVEAHGVPVEVHRGDPARLARLAAQVGRWYAWRGRLGRTLDMLRDAGADDGVSAESWSDDGRAPDMRDEVFSIHTLDWWRARTPRAPRAMVIRGGLLRTDEPTLVVREDIVLALRPGHTVDPTLLRVLPAAISVRVVVKES